jgi:hypothetical protein
VLEVARRQGHPFFDHPIILTIGFLAALKALGIIKLDFGRGDE